MMHYLVRPCCLIVLGVVCLAACGDSAVQATATNPPTLELVPPTHTPTLLPATDTPTPMPIPTNVLDVLTPESSLAVPTLLPISAQDVINTALSDAESRFDTTAGALRVLGLKFMVWTLPELSCMNRSIEGGVFSPWALDGLRGYRLVIGNDMQAGVYYASLDGEILFCQDVDLLDRYGVPLSADPITGETIQLARDALARRLEVAPEQINVADVLTITWRDSSLGCPQEGENYDAQMNPGYRVLLEYGGVYYAYHADFIAVLFCPLEREALPRPFAPTATPSSTPTP